jgi:ABC-type multidrug transport system fused ATPase/permease subunit
MIYMGIVYYIGTICIRNWGIGAKNVYLCINVLMQGIMAASVSMSNIPSMGRAKASARKIFSIVDEKSKLDIRDAEKSSI